MAANAAAQIKSWMFLSLTSLIVRQFLNMAVLLWLVGGGVSMISRTAANEQHGDPGVLEERLQSIRERTKNLEDIGIERRLATLERSVIHIDSVIAEMRADFSRVLFGVVGVLAMWAFNHLMALASSLKSKKGGG